jgi:hypothetical protein
MRVPVRLLAFTVWTAVVAATACGQLSGVIFTSTKSGSTVNGNIYTKKTAVYLNGGPGPSAPCSAAGLPDGKYYFQVTNPSGSVLLSTDSILNREVTVSGGVITGYEGTHKKGKSLCNGISVALMPYADTPNAGGEYKVWLTPMEKYVVGMGFHGFIPKFSKSDNYKIKGPGKLVPQCVIRGYKFYDFNENRMWDAGVPEEVPIAGWRVEIWKNGQRDGVTFTDDNGRYTFIRDLDSTVYTVLEVAPPPGFIPAPEGIWLPMTPVQGNVTTDAENVKGPDFGNLSFRLTPGVGRTKGFWHNENGRALLLACDTEWRDVLNGPFNDPTCLRDNDGSIFTVPGGSFTTAFGAFENWIVGNPALGNAGFILSSQLAATLLNNTCGFMQGTIYIDRRQDKVLVSLKDMIAGAKGLLCDPRAADLGPDTQYPDFRDRVLACINEFETTNNTGDLNNPQVVYGVTSEPESFMTPYGEGF